jgi:type IV secretory pathway VirB2 component (pilin)
MALEAIADTVRLLAIIASILVISYAGLMLLTSKDALVRAQWKDVILGVLLGLSIVFLAPIISTSLNRGSYCG